MRRARVALVCVVTVLAALAGGLCLGGCEATDADAPATVAPEGLRTVAIHVEGMTCNDCEQKIVKAIERIPGVSSCTASHTASEATVVIDNPRVGDDVLVQTIAALGYEAKLASSPAAAASASRARSAAR